MIRRNSVVYDDKGGTLVLFGRVIRVTNGKALVVDCGRYISLVPLERLKEVDYKGTKDYKGRMNWMPSLRALKQMASRYDKTIWKRNRKSEFPRETCVEYFAPANG